MKKAQAEGLSAEEISAMLEGPGPDMTDMPAPKRYRYGILDGLGLADGIFEQEHGTRGLRHPLFRHSQAGLRALAEQLDNDTITGIDDQDLVELVRERIEQAKQPTLLLESIRQIAHHQRRQRQGDGVQDNDAMSPVGLRDNMTSPQAYVAGMLFGLWVGLGSFEEYRSPKSGESPRYRHSFLGLKVRCHHLIRHGKASARLGDVSLSVAIAGPMSATMALAKRAKKARQT